VKKKKNDTGICRKMVSALVNRDEKNKVFVESKKRRYQRSESKTGKRIKVETKSAS